MLTTNQTLSEFRSQFLVLVSRIMLLAIAAAHTGCANSWKEEVNKEVTTAEKRFAELEAAGDLEGQFSMMAEDYAYIDNAGKRLTKQQLRARRGEDERRGTEVELQDLEVLPLAQNAAVTRGRWNVRAEYYGGLPRVSASRYMALWQKLNGRWLLVSDQSTPLVEREVFIRERIQLTPEEVRPYAGMFRLDTTTHLEVELETTDEGLRLRIPGHLEEGVSFVPNGPSTFFTTERPWEIAVMNGGKEIVLTTWGEKTRGQRIQ